MSATAALWVVNWVAMGLLLLAIGAVYRDVRLLRAAVVADGYSAEADEVTFSSAITAGRDVVVIAADTGCPLCHAAAQAAVRLAQRGADPAVLLTHEPAAAWPAAIRQGVRVVTDVEEWQKIAHFSTPILLRVSADGRVREHYLPQDERRTDAQLARWMTGNSITQ